MKLRLLTKRLTYALLCMSLGLTASAQTKTVSGKVTSDKDGTPISGASVVAKGTSKGTQTSASGTYTLDVAASVNTLIISSVGFGTSEVSVNGANTDLVLNPLV